MQCLTSHAVLLLLPLFVAMAGKVVKVGYLVQRKVFIVRNFETIHLRHVS